MNLNELKELLSNGESTTVEFKRKISTAEKIAKEITAFANTIGGWLLIGIDDDGSMVGIESEKSDIDFIEKICGFYIDPPITPVINIIPVSKKDILAIHINKSKKRPHSVVLDPNDKKSERKTYIRVGEKSLIASREMTQVLSALNDETPLKLSIGDKEKRLFTYLEKYEKASVKDFAKLVNISVRRAERLLVRLVRAGVLQIHVNSDSDYFTLISGSKIDEHRSIDMRE